MSGYMSLSTPNLRYFVLFEFYLLAEAIYIHIYFFPCIFLNPYPVNDQSAPLIKALSRCLLHDLQTSVPDNFLFPIYKVRTNICQAAVIPVIPFCYLRSWICIFIDLRSLIWDSCKSIVGQKNSTVTKASTRRF